VPTKLGSAIQSYVSGRGSGEAVVAAGAPICRRHAASLVEPAAVDDVVQESLVELLASAHRLRQPEAAEAWLRLIVRKQAERHRRRLRLPLPLDLAVEFPSFDEGPEAALVRAEQDAAVRRALQAAREDDRRLLVLRYMGGWSDAELADLLGLSAGAVRKRLHDARRRLRPHLEYLNPPASTEESMTDAEPVPFGTVVAPDELTGTEPVPFVPAGAEVLATGLRVIDAVVPIRRGGTVDFLGPVGTGHLVVLTEIAKNLAAAPGGAAVVALATSAKDPDGSAVRLQRLNDASEGIPELTVVVDASADPTAALRSGGRLASSLASRGRNVLLLVDRVAAGHLDAAAVGEHVGLAGSGSVTVIRLAPHARDADPAEAWSMDCSIVLSLERMAAGIFPTVDVLASRSSLIDQYQLPEEAVRLATEVRQALGVAAALNSKLAQPFFVAEAYTGTPGIRVSPEQARADLAAVL
jgi:RNA polymerase sigma factor (sigma-70 family)